VVHHAEAQQAVPEQAQRNRGDEADRDEDERHAERGPDPRREEVV
jgi:hypothetical protein